MVVVAALPLPVSSISSCALFGFRGAAVVGPFRYRICVVVGCLLRDDTFNVVCHVDVVALEL